MTNSEITRDSFLSFKENKSKYINIFNNSRDSSKESLFRGGNQISESMLSPSFDQLLEMLNLLESSDLESPFIEELINNFGAPVWNSSILNIGETADDYVIYLPFSKDKDVNAIILYIKFGNEYKFELIPRPYLDEWTNERKVYTKKAKRIINAFIAFDYHIAKRVDDLLIEWVQNHNIERIKQSQSRYEICRLIEVCEYEWVDVFTSDCWHQIGTRVCEYEYECIEVSSIHWTAPFYNGTGYVFPDGWQQGGGFGYGTGNKKDNKPNNKNDDSEKLTEEVEDCLMGKFSQTSIDGLLADIDFPCGDINNAIINNAIQGFMDQNNGDCPSKFDVVDLINEELEGVSTIIEEESFKNCKNLKCLYDRLKENSDQWCNTYGNFEFRPFANVRLQVGDAGLAKKPDFEGKTLGFTTVDNEGNLTIAFNPSLCDDESTSSVPNPLLLGVVILHEGIHADINQYVLDNISDATNFGDVSEMTYNEIFNELMNVFCNETDNKMTEQHELMMNTSIDFLAKAMWEYNDQIGDWTDYKYLAWAGIWNSKSSCAKNILSVEEYNILKDNYNSNVTVSPSLFDCN